MPFISENMCLQGLQDRRRKLTEEQKLQIKVIYALGMHSQQALATMYRVSKRTIQLTVNPTSLALHKAYQKGRWKIYYDTEYQTNSKREHRRYKYDLYLKGELK